MGVVSSCVFNFCPCPVPRLRHERLKPLKVDRGGPNEYQMLRCYNLDTTSQPESPRQMRKNKDDFYVGEEVTSSR